MSLSHSDFISELLRSLRGEIMAGYGKVDHTLKDDLSVVTEIDKNIEKRIVEALSTKYPDIGFNGEENGRKGSTERYWLIDPIDGTENYIRGLPGFATILGLVEDGKVTQSYIYDPFEDVVYYALKDLGAYANSKRISISIRDIHRSNICLTGGMKLRINLLKILYEAGVSRVDVVYGPGVKFLYLATGKIEGLVVNNEGTGGGPWDFAVGAMFAKEAGAILTSFDGGGIKSRSYALLNPTINEELLPVIKEQIQNEN